MELKRQQEDFHEIQQKHSGKYKVEQLRTWAHMYHLQTHDSLDSPPDKLGNTKKRCSSMTFSGERTTESKRAAVTTRAGVSPGRQVNIRSELIDQFKKGRLSFHPIPCDRMHPVCVPHAPRMCLTCAPSLYDIVLYFTLAQITEKCGKYSCFSWGLSCGVPKAAGLAMASTPEWASTHNLEICGQYYQGFVDDFEVGLSQHRMCTVTTYGVRRSRSKASSPVLHLVQERRMKVLSTNILVRQVCVTISVVLFRYPGSTGIKWRVEKT